MTNGPDFPANTPFEELIASLQSCLSTDPLQCQNVLLPIIMVQIAFATTTVQVATTALQEWVTAHPVDALLYVLSIILQFYKSGPFVGRNFL